MLAEKEVPVIQCCGMDGDHEVIGAGSWSWNILKLQAVACTVSRAILF